MEKGTSCSRYLDLIRSHCKSSIERFQMFLSILFFFFLLPFTSQIRFGARFNTDFSHFRTWKLAVSPWFLFNRISHLMTARVDPRRGIEGWYGLNVNRFRFAWPPQMWKTESIWFSLKCNSEIIVFLSRINRSTRRIFHSTLRELIRKEETN